MRAHTVYDLPSHAWLILPALLLTACAGAPAPSPLPAAAAAGKDAADASAAAPRPERLLLDKALAGFGGAERIDRLRTLVVESTMTRARAEGQQTAIRQRTYVEFPNRFRREAILEGMTMASIVAPVTQIVFYVRDNHGADITGSWCVFDVESNVGSGYDGTCSAVGGTSGTPGQTFFFSEPATTVQRRFHNGTEFRIGSYGLLFWPGAATDQLDIRMARILWRRQVSPAPASATFDDVPTSHLFFRSIEALADAGITGGCGDGSNYCPNSP